MITLSYVKGKFDFPHNVEVYALVIFTILVMSVAYICQNFQRLKAKIIKFTFRSLRKNKYYKNFMKGQIDTIFASFEKELRENMKPKSSINAMPLVGWSQESVLERASEGTQTCEAKWKDGFCSGAVYSGNSGLARLCGKVFEMFAYHNPMHFDLFPSVVRMEIECIKMISNMFNGDTETIGCITTCGTESNMLACKAYRGMAMERGVIRPTMLVPMSAHCSFDKAADLFGIEIIHVDLDSDSMKVDTKKMEKLIDNRTCMLVGSAPNYPHGIFDPIEEISALGVTHSVPVHVDCCLGGFLVGFADENLRKKLPLFDYRLPGVTSISCDPHKYGLTPKGISTITYRNEDYMKYQYSVIPDWQGGFYSTISFSGSRCGALIATCWATFMYLGRQFYVDQCKKIVAAAQKIKNRLKEIEEIEIMGDPQLSIVAFRTKSVSIYSVGDILTEKEWSLNFLQNPASIHICVTEFHVRENVIDRLVGDILLAVKISNKHGDSKGDCSRVYGTLARIPDEGAKVEFGKKFLNLMMSCD